MVAFSCQEDDMENNMINNMKMTYLSSSDDEKYKVINGRNLPKMERAGDS